MLKDIQPKTTSRGQQKNKIKHMSQSCTNLKHEEGRSNKSKFNEQICRIFRVIPLIVEVETSNGGTGVLTIQGPTNLWSSPNKHEKIQQRLESS